MENQIALVTGASRGVGARVAVLLAEAGADVVMNYRERTPLAEKVAQKVDHAGRRALTVRADLTDASATGEMLAAVARTFGKLDVLVLNASGGMESGMPADYPTRLNVEAQLRAVDLALPLMPSGSRIVFVTSHQAHFHGERPSVPEYEAVAASKKAGELALRGRLSELSERGISLVVVSGDVIERTVTANLLERLRPGFLQERRVKSGRLLSVEEFASAVVSAARGRLDTGATVLVGPSDPSQ